MHINELLKELNYAVTGGEATSSDIYGEVRDIMFGDAIVSFTPETGKVNEIYAVVNVTGQHDSVEVFWVDPMFEVEYALWAKNNLTSAQRAELKQVFSLTKMVEICRAAAADCEIEEDDLYYIDLTLEPEEKEKIERAAELAGVTPERFIIQAVEERIKELKAMKPAAKKTKKATTK